ncbi:hypothetical protein KP001_09775 [Geomonas subterranea]|uniref:Uncharacterized protein n=1 Tax=Geomonas subterranea TaxID=2847989 RepID=A0ABX8LMR4_9BACT|nr:MULTISPECIES: hypothetical protein [Geomonas]QXE87822.1 hypothetical protein KP003_05305 [Geomonas nitrogeniifigens]QXE92779.1 hypothetical protein KP001_09775 [Geomonas subterranea]QXM09117.1 hypothetical protein KP002_19500 [Geomonas subterranea]
MAGSKSILTSILATKLSPAERSRFIEWSNGVTNEEFDDGLSLFFKIEEVQDAIGDYAIEQIQEIENHCNIKISAVIRVDGSTYKYRQ